MKDREASELIYKRFHERIFQYVYRRTLDFDVAEDITSETFLTAHQALRRFQWRGVSFDAYLFRIARNLVYRHARERAGSPLNGLQAMLSNQEWHAIHATLDRLPDEMRETITLHYWEMLSVGEIAEVLRIPEGKVKSNLQRARALLQTMLNKDDDPPNGGLGAPVPARPKPPFRPDERAQVEPPTSA